jgi:hypothetical protein
LADIHEDITGDSSSLVEALQDAVEPAEELAGALKQIRDALAALDGASEGLEETGEELDSARDKAAELAQTVDDAQAALDALAASGPDLGDIEAMLLEDAEAAGSFRDNLAAAAAAEDQVAASAAGLGDAGVALEADAEAAGHLRDNLAEVAAEEAAVEDGVSLIGQSFSRVTQQIRNQMSTMDLGDLKNFAIQRSGVGFSLLPQGGSASSLADLEDEMASESALNLVQSFQAAGYAAGDYEKQLANLSATVAEADKFIESQAGIIDDLGDATNDFIPKFQAETAAVSEFREAWQAFSQTGAWDDLARLQYAAENLGPALAEASAAGEDIEQTFGGIDEAGQAVAAGLADAALALQDIEQAGQAATPVAESLTGLFGDLGSAAGDAWEKIPLFGVAIGGMVVGALALAPALAAVVSGFVSFGALALPALEKVKDGYDSIQTGLAGVTKARAAYAEAVERENADRTTTHAKEVKDALASEKVAIDALNKSFASMSPPVSAAVADIIQFKNAWDRVSANSGIQNAAIGDIGQVLKDATEFLPSFVTLAKGAEPVISQFWAGIGKNLDSSGWSKFVDSMEKDIQPAANAFHSIATGVSDYLSAFQEKGAGPSNQFIESFGRLLKTTAPDAVTATVNAIDLLTHAINGLNDATKNTAIAGFAHDLDDLWKAGSKADELGAKFDKSFFSGSYLPDWLSGNKPLTPRIDTKIDTAALQRTLEEIGAGLPPLDVHAKVTRIDTSALQRSLSADAGPGAALTAHAKVQADTSTSDLQKQVDDAAKNVKIAGVEVDLADAKLSGLAALQPVLTQAGKTAGQDFVTAVITTITAGDARGEGAARQLAADIRAGMSALAGQMQAIGRDADLGLAQGINADQGAAVAAARDLAAAVEAAARVHLQTQSPSKVFEDIGKETVAGFVIGLEGGKSAVQTAIDDVFDQAKPFNDSTITAMITKMRDEIEAAARAGVISTSTESTYSRWLTADNQRLQSLAQRRQSIEQEINAADAMSASVSGGVRSSALVANAYGMTYQGQAATTPVYSSITAALQAQLQQTREFRTDIEKLKKEGLSGAQIGDILDQGVSGGLPIAQQILAGGKAGIRQINELEKELAAAGKALGITGANASYESGSEMGKGLAAGLRSELKTIDNEMKRVADELVDAIKRALRISSPSGVMMDIGGQIGDGLIAGMEAKRAAITAAGERMSASATGYLPSRGYGGGGSGSGGDMPPTEIHLTVISKMDAKEIGRSTQKVLLQHARRNVKTGLQLQGRGI